jgi:enoyl-CoA hydratase/carnithine racemase
MPSNQALSPPVHSDEVKVSFPAERVLLLTLNRPKYLNAMTPQMEHDIKTVLNWFESEPSLWWVLPFYADKGVFSFITRCKGFPLSRVKDVHSVQGLISKRE